MTPDDPSSRPPATGEDLAPVEPERVDAGPTRRRTSRRSPPRISPGARAPRGPGEISLEGHDPKQVVFVDIDDPLNGIASVSAALTGAVPESQVTHRQSKSVSSGAPTGDSQTPPASTAP